MWDQMGRQQTGINTDMLLLCAFQKHCKLQSPHIQFAFSSCHFLSFDVTGTDTVSIVIIVSTPVSFFLYVTNVRQEALRQRLKLLTEEKSDLQSQLMDCHFRIEQEGKVQLTEAQNNMSLGPELKCLCCFGPVICTSCFKFFLVIKNK